MPIFERPPLDTLAPAKDRWTPIYLEYGRLEVDDSSIKWIGSDGLITRLPVATVSALIIGPGTSITHAAVKAAAQCNCPLLWLGEDGLRFYAFGITPNHDNSMARDPGCLRWRALRFPHPRGDGPSPLSGNSTHGLISPPTWGWMVWARKRALPLFGHPPAIMGQKKLRIHPWSGETGRLGSGTQNSFRRDNPCRNSRRESLVPVTRVI